MPCYVFRLHDGVDTPPIIENVDAFDDRDARDLAQMRLLLTREYTHAHIYRGAYKVAELKRDSVPN
ncbi:hypothetical protein [Brevundimonas sp.]|uniref:hypothetical protein n=1 Tax=Brevundimonas sp. TaxID=1871086 RepID=UPI003D0C8C0E